MPKPMHSASRARQDEEIDRMDRQRAQGVDLLGDFHRADFRAHRRADAPGEHQAGEHGAELAAHRHRDQGADRRLHAEDAELKIRLRRKHRAGERAGDRHDRLRAEAEFDDLRQHEAPADFGNEERHERFPRQHRDAAGVLHQCQHGAAERADEAGHDARTKVRMHGGCKRPVSPLAFRHRLH